MGIFKKVEPEIKEVEEEVVDDLHELRSAVDKILKLVEGRKNVVALTDEVVALKTSIADLEINKSKLTESHEREKREVQHFVGLEKKRQEVEIDQATREATLKVREENLDADKARFDDHIKFVEEKQAKHLDDIKALLSQVMDRIPTVTVDVTKSASTTPARTARKAS